MAINGDPSRALVGMFDPPRKGAHAHRPPVFGAPTGVGTAPMEAQGLDHCRRMLLGARPRGMAAHKQKWATKNGTWPKRATPMHLGPNGKGDLLRWVVLVEIAGVLGAPGGGSCRGRGAKAPSPFGHPRL